MDNVQTPKSPTGALPPGLKGGIAERRKAIVLWTTVGRNTQRERVNWADDYALESLHWVRCTGP